MGEERKTFVFTSIGTVKNDFTVSEFRPLPTFLELVFGVDGQENVQISMNSTPPMHAPIHLVTQRAALRACDCPGVRSEPERS